MSTQSKILICDDHQSIHDTLIPYLEKDGFEYRSAFDGEEAMNLIGQELPDLIILDIMMPKKSGTDVCRDVRAKHNIPIIMLTARDEEIDRVLGLELGADDYIVKPFSAREVIARVKAVLRRYSEQKKASASIIRHSNLEININNYDVRVNGKSLRLTPKEVEILQMLASAPGRVFTREQILTQVWGYDYDGEERAVDTQIKRIRQKLPLEPMNWQIKTIYGVGYKFEVSE